MNDLIQQKMDALKKIMRIKQTTKNTTNHHSGNQKDALSMAIRSEKDAMIFLDDLRSVIEKLR